jgi:tRNA (mo5U34)-methyltransferase
MKRRGAKEVVAIDEDERYLRQAALAARVLKVDINLQKMSVYEVASLRRRFDVVLFMGVLYHLRHPLLALDTLYEHSVGELMVFQSMLRGSLKTHSAKPDYPFEEWDIFNEPEYPKLHFVEHSYSHDATNWWIPNRACVEGMLRSAGFVIETGPEDEVYVCRRGRRG